MDFSLVQPMPWRARCWPFSRPPGGRANLGGCILRDLLAACVVAIVVGATSVALGEIAITSCGETVPAGKKGVLQNDVRCEYRCTGDRSIVCGFDDDVTCVGKGSCDPEYLTLKRGAVLDLNGHSLGSAYQGYAVICRGPRPDPGRCVVKGPGSISGDSAAILSSKSDVFVQDVSILPSSFAVYTKGRVVMRRSTIAQNYENSIYGKKSVTLIDVASNADVIESGGDIELRRVELGPERNEVVTRANVLGHDVVMTGIARIKGYAVKLQRATTHVPDYRWTSVEGTHRVRLINSSVTYVGSGEKPQLVRSSCEQSFVSDAQSSSWGVCAND